MMSAKLATLSLLKIKVFWNEDCDVIIFVHAVINKILSRYPDYIADVVMWRKFSVSTIPMREVTITPILQGFDQKNFWMVLLVQVQ